MLRLQIHSAIDRKFPLTGNEKKYEELLQEHNAASERGPVSVPVSSRIRKDSCVNDRVLHIRIWKECGAAFEITRSGESADGVSHTAMFHDSDTTSSSSTTSQRRHPKR